LNDEDSSGNNMSSIFHGSLLKENNGTDIGRHTQMLARDPLFNSVAPEAVGIGFAWQLMILV